MDSKKKKKLEARGWVVDDTSDFLQLTAEEARYTEVKLALSESLKAERLKQQVTQVELARMIGSSQSRVAKMESGDPAVTVDLLLKALLTLGVTRKQLAKIITWPGTERRVPVVRAPGESMTESTKTWLDAGNMALAPNVQCRYNVNMAGLRIEWDPRKAASNLKKHGVSFKEAATVFSDDNARLIRDPDHSEAEDRFILLGLGSSLRVLIVCHCYREAADLIRIISARKANRSERDQYLVG